MVTDCKTWYSSSYSMVNACIYFHHVWSITCDIWYGDTAFMNVDLYVLHISLVNTFVKMNVIKLHCMRSLCRQLSTSCGVFSYKSAICLENIYPKSNLSITTATEVCFMFFVMWMMKHKCECNSVMKEACETMITVFSFHWRSRMCYKLNQTQQ